MLVWVMLSACSSGPDASATSAPPVGPAAEECVQPSYAEADELFAQELILRLDDLPQPLWSEQPHRGDHPCSDSNVESRACFGLPNFTQENTAEVDSPDYLLNDNRLDLSILSNVTAMQTVRSAEDLFNRQVSSTGAECLRMSFSDAGLVPFAALDFELTEVEPRVSTDSELFIYGYDVVFSSQSGDLSLAMEMALLTRGRFVVTLAMTSITTPLDRDLFDSLITKTDDRLVAGIK